MINRTLPPLQVKAWLIVFLTIQVAWFIKHYWFVPNFFACFEYPVQSHPMFSGGSLNPVVSLTAYLLPLGTLPLLLLKNSRWALFAASLVLVVASWLVVTHIYGFNDATFVTCFWGALWLAYLSWPGGGDSDRGVKVANSTKLAKRIISLFFLGGVIGKLTDGYWDGTVFYQLYFHGKPYFPFTYLRETLSSDTLMMIAVWFSRCVVICELALVTSFLWNTRIFASAIVLVTIGMIMISKIQLFSVLGPLVAMAIVVVYLEKEIRHESKLVQHARPPRAFASDSKPKTTGEMANSEA